MVESDKFIMFNMDDPHLKKVSEALGNKTAKKIIDFLSENKEGSEKDISDNLKIPLNTVEYNIKKLVEVGIVKKHKNFFWSKKGKKIVLYELSNKSIVISPRGSSVSEKLKSLVPGFLVVGAGSFAAYVYEKINYGFSQGGDAAISPSVDILQKSASDSAFILEESARVGGDVASNIISVGNSTSGSPLWMWFFLGGLIALAVVALVNWRRL